MHYEEKKPNIYSGSESDENFEETEYVKKVEVNYGNQELDLNNIINMSERDFIEYITNCEMNKQQNQSNILSTRRGHKRGFYTLE